jgi:hypothetical protein
VQVRWFTPVLLLCIAAGTVAGCSLIGRAFWSGRFPVRGFVENWPFSPTVGIRYLRFTGLAPLVAVFGFLGITLNLYIDQGWQPRALVDALFVPTFLTFLVCLLGAVVVTLSGRPRVLVPGWVRALEAGELPVAGDGD